MQGSAVGRSSCADFQSEGTMNEHLSETWKITGLLDIPGGLCFHFVLHVCIHAVKANSLAPESCTVVDFVRMGSSTGT